jgi:type II secretory pathway pseudopilin PulG
VNAGHGLKTRATLCGGLTFLEVMFAVIILGIGFIMLAAIFPVAMQQQQGALESAQADAIFVNAKAVLTQLAGQKITGHPSNNQGPFLAEAVSPATMVQRFDNPSWTNAIAGSVIDAANPHYAWCALYARSGGATGPGSAVNVLLFALASRNQTTLGQGDLVAPAGYGSNVEPQTVTVNAVTPKGTPGTNTITFNADSNGLYKAACPGAYVVMQAITGGKPYVYQLSELVNPSDLTTWYISPAHDLASSDPTSNPEEVTSPTVAWLIGRGFKTVNSNSAVGPVGPVVTDGFSGNCQVIGFASSYDNPALAISITQPNF